jgi:transcriptional regulator with XRE-family HTH domain
MKKTDLKDNRKERSVDLYMTGGLLRTRLDRAGLSVKQVQKVLGLECPQSIYRWLSGQALPSVENLYVLHRILSCSMEDLIVTRDRPQQIRCAAYFTAIKK